MMKHYDIVFCGLGVGACLLLRELERRQCLGKFSICIVEPSLKIKNDKTLCFWANKENVLVKENADIISQSWSHATVPPFGIQPLSPYEYHQVESAILYKKTHSLLKNYNIDQIQNHV